MSLEEKPAIAAATASTAPVEKQDAAEKLTSLLDHPATDIKIQADGSVRVGRFQTLWQRLKASWVLRLQAALSALAVIWLAIPQDVIMALVPSKYVAAGALLYAIFTALARMRNI